jgi:hypothetical protein
MQMLVESLENEIKLKCLLAEQLKNGKNKQNNNNNNNKHHKELFSCSSCFTRNKSHFKYNDVIKIQSDLEKVKNNILKQLLNLNKNREKKTDSNTFSHHTSRSPHTDTTSSTHDGSTKNVNDYYVIPDSDRVAINEAILLKLDERYMKVLLEDYPRALEHGGVVDHVNHPIHTACRENKNIVETLLKYNPDCAFQCDEQGRYPIEIYLFDSGNRQQDAFLDDHHNHHHSESPYREAAIRLFGTTTYNPASLPKSFIKKMMHDNVVVQDIFANEIESYLDSKS